MPKASAQSEKTPRRRRGAVAVEAETERNFALQMLLSHPKDMIAGAIAFAAVTAIVANALFLQAGRHPSPMFGSSVVVPLASSATVNPLPKPRPLEAAANPADARAAESRLLEGKPINPKAAEPKPADARSSDPRSSDPMANLVKSTSAAPAANVARPPAPIPASTRHDPLGDMITTSRRVATVQRTLTEYGYGQLKPTGTVGSDTQVAIQKFERDRKLSVTGQMSDRLVRELAVMTGRPID